ncbi:MAG: DUF4364 family protein [Lachnospiraceae bacterium]|nr:DUF4364 family protein [Lachnospiraceae bacterium]MDD3796126.1 DUF4364 family protein [Lachnospiraceae bacterium]
MSEPFTLYKLIVLYMLKKIDFALTNSQISDFILEQGYTTYFTLQSVLSELSDSGLVRQETIRNSSHYTITSEGEETLRFFENRISRTIRDDIDRYLKENKMKLRNEVSVLADYYRNTTNEFNVRCRVKEKYSDLIDLTLTVPDENQAKAICQQWDKKCQMVYEYIMKELMQD